MLADGALARAGQRRGDPELARLRVLDEPADFPLAGRMIDVADVRAAARGGVETVEVDRFVGSVVDREILHDEHVLLAALAELAAGAVDLVEVDEPVSRVLRPR